MASGYVTAYPESFSAHLEGYEEHFLKTGNISHILILKAKGDVGFVYDGRLFVLGRLCDLIKLADNRVFFPDAISCCVLSFYTSRI